jgi:hypothetical protein
VRIGGREDEVCTEEGEKGCEGLQVSLHITENA